jgi:pimeloyl-ACP methyl ester carboxylesterase
MMKSLGADMASWRRVAELRTLTQRVLFIRGEHDFVADDDVAVFAAARRGSEVVRIPDAGHLAFLDDSDATNEAVGRFLRSVEG